MSKSLGNTVPILAEPDEIWERVRTAVTDPQRVRRTDPGRPEVCNVFTLHQHFSSPDVVARVEADCRSAGIGCVECKRLLADAIAAEFGPVRERAAHLKANPAEVRRVLEDGASKARAIARETIGEVKRRMGLTWRDALPS
jgi:tryptophanyl-tRNA synthetase